MPYSKALIASFITVVLPPFFLPLDTHAQTCPRAFTIRQESCPAGPSTCTTKGATLTFQELDYDLLNIVGLCNGPGRYTWPAPSSGLLSSNGSGIISIVADDDTPDSDAEVPDAITVGGGVLTGTNLVTGILNLDTATEGTLRYPTSTTLPATCTLGDSYWDTDADTDGSLYICRATNTWKDVDDDGGAPGGGAPTDALYVTLGTNATLTNERVLTAGVGLSSTDAGAGSTLTLFFTTADTLAGNPTYSTEDVVFTKDGTGGGLLFEGATADTVEGILTWNPTTSDKTIAFPDVSGAVVTTGDTGTISATMIASDAVTETKLKLVDSPADEECLTYESTGGDFEWQSCGTGSSGGSAVDPLTNFDLSDEFCQRNTSANVHGSHNWTVYGTASGEIAPEANHPCISYIYTDATNGNVNALGLGRASNTDLFRVPDHLDRLTWVVKSDATITTMEVRVGFMDDLSSTTGGDGFFVEYDSSVSPNWRCVTRQGGTTTATVSSVAYAANTWFQVEAERDASNNHRCYVNSGTAFATHTTNLPTGNLNVGIAVQTNAAAARYLLYDMVKMKGKTLGSRY